MADRDGLKQSMRILVAGAMRHAFDMGGIHKNECNKVQDEIANNFEQYIDRVIDEASAIAHPAAVEPARKAIDAQGAVTAPCEECDGQGGHTGGRHETDYGTQCKACDGTGMVDRAASPLPAATLGKADKSNMKDRIRSIFMRHGFTIKDGHDDLKDYVYAAAFELLAQQPAASDVREVPDIFWLADDGENSYGSLEDAVEMTLQSGEQDGELIEFTCAKSLPNITVRVDLSAKGNFVIVEDQSTPDVQADEGRK